jgi:hypothetical protein
MPRPDAFLGMPYNVRQEFLQNNWGFKCTCSLCEAPDQERSSSDERRMRIVKLRDEIDHARTAKQYERAISLVMELIRFCETEELFPLIPGFHEMLAGIYEDMGNVSEAKRYGKITLQGWFQFESIDSYRVESAMALVRRMERAEKHSRSGLS